MKKGHEILNVDGIEIEVSNRAKLIFPADGITKGELIDYYSRVAETILTYLRDRLLTMVRYPSGIEGEGFFQKDVDGRVPDWVGRAEVEKESGRITHVVCNDRPTLVYLANLACISTHVTLSRVDRLHNPDQMIFDLDPPGGDFSPVRKAAKKLKAFLNGLGLEAFLKTTGSNGLHVMVPLDRSADFDRVRSFARAVSQRLAQMYPQELTVEQRKDKRAGRVYIDVLRNAYGQTAVSAYSVRARPGAPVSTPLDWEELDNRRMDSRKYSIRNVFRRLARTGDPWAAAAGKAYSIKGALSGLNEIREARGPG